MTASVSILQGCGNERHVSQLSVSSACRSEPMPREERSIFVPKSRAVRKFVSPFRYSLNRMTSAHKLSHPFFDRPRLFIIFIRRWAAMLGEPVFLLGGGQ